MKKFENHNFQVFEESIGWDPILGSVSTQPKGENNISIAAEEVSKASIRATPTSNVKTPRSIPSHKDYGRGELEFLSARDIATRTSEKPDWIWKPYVIKGGITEITGKIKSAGKTTLVTHACRQVLNGGYFLGYPMATTGVMYLTEQTEGSFREALRRADLLDREDFYVLTWYRTRGISWSEIVARAVEEAKQRNLGLLVVDTLPRFANLKGDSENNSGDALEAMEPLQIAAGQGLGVIIVRHERKSGGEVGDAGRGSSAFGGEADIVVSIKRPEGKVRPTIREIQALGRFDETPEKLVVELTDQGYRALGSDAAVAEEEAREAILKVLPRTQDKAMTLDEILTKTKENGVKRTVAQDALKAMHDDNSVARSGGGVKGDPYRYWQVDNTHAPVDSSNPVLKDKPLSPSQAFLDTVCGEQDPDQETGLDNRVNNLVNEPEGDPDSLEPDISKRMSVIVQCLDEIFEENPRLEVDPKIFEENPNRKVYRETQSLWSWHMPGRFYEPRFSSQLTEPRERLRPTMEEINEAIKIRAAKTKRNVL